MLVFIGFDGCSEAIDADKGVVDDDGVVHLRMAEDLLVVGAGKEIVLGECPRTHPERRVGWRLTGHIQKLRGVRAEGELRFVVKPEMYLLQAKIIHKMDHIDIIWI